MKKRILLAVVIVAIFYMPCTVFAVVDDTNNNKIIEEAQREELNNSTINPQSMFSARYAHTEYNLNINRSQRIALRRTSASQGITLTATSYGSRNIDVCVFSRNSSTNIIGNTKTIPGNQLSVHTWTASELGSTLNVDLFFTMYTNATQRLQIAVTH